MPFYLKSQFLSSWKKIPTTFGSVISNVLLVKLLNYLRENKGNFRNTKKQFDVNRERFRVLIWFWTTIFVSQPFSWNVTIKVRNQIINIYKTCLFIYIYTSYICTKQFLRCIIKRKLRCYWTTNLTLMWLE